MKNDLNDYLIFKANKGLEKRFNKLSYPIDKDVYKKRLAYELDIIIKMGFSGYFLVVQDFVNWSKENNILVGDGRGSGAGSLVAFALGITNVDPIKYDLYFERFLNPARVSMPDFDIDFQKDRRSEVVQYVKEKHGEAKVAQIGTFGTFKAKKSIKDVARVLGHPLSVADNLCKIYPKPIHGKEVSLKDALTTNEQLKAFKEGNGPEAEILKWAEKIEGRVASFGIHAAGVVISNDALSSIVPLALGKNGEVVTQWDMGNVEEVGLIKFDFLGLKTLTLISTTLKFIEETTGNKIDIETIPDDDQEVYANLTKGDNIGIFQLEASTGIRDLTVKVRPTCISDLAAIGAMYRPGPLGSDQMQTYLDWRAGVGKPHYHHPDLEPILSETGSWLVYQEQVLRIARDLAGFTLAEADILRRAVGKKKAKEMAEQKSKFFDGLKKNGYSEELGKTLWHEIDAFSDYGFNKSHAVAYALITYKTAWLKTHYPVQFMAAALSCDSGNQDQMIVYMQECKRMNIPVLPPDVNESGLIFTPTGNSIRFGLSAIKNIGESANHILAVRKENGLFNSFFDFCQKVDLSIVNKRKLESLVLSGCFDFTHENRSTLLQAVDSVLDYKDKQKSYLSKMATYEKKLLAVEERLQQIENGVKNEKGKPLKPLSSPTKPEKVPFPVHIECPEMNKRDILNFEKELTGQFISGHPLDNVKKKATYKISDIKFSNERPEYVDFIAIISEIQLKETKQKKRMAFLKFEDLTGTLDGTIFPGNYAKNLDVIIKNVPLHVTGKIDYIDSETDEGEIVLIPSMIIHSLEFVPVANQNQTEITFDVPLTFKNISKVYTAVNKTEKGDQKIRLQFNTSSRLNLASSTTLSVINERNFRTNFNK